MRQWAAVDNNGNVVHGFDASQSYVDNYVELIVRRADRETPAWYNEGITFMDVTGVEPRPVLGFYRESGVWIDSNPKLTCDKASIPGDGTTAAVVTFTQVGRTAPVAVQFDVNGTLTDYVNLSGDEASIEVVSSNPGDQITVKVGALSVSIEVV